MTTRSVTLAEVQYGIARLPAGRRRALLSNAADDVFGAFATHNTGDFTRLDLDLIEPWLTGS